ncbi:hypothetical protein AAHE18_14G009700 [Arachis hypogaea]
MLGWSETQSLLCVCSLMRGNWWHERDRRSCWHNNDSINRGKGTVKESWSPWVTLMTWRVAMFVVKKHPRCALLDHNKSKPLRNRRCRVLGLKRHTHDHGQEEDDEFLLQQLWFVDCPKFQMCFEVDVHVERQERKP